MTTMNAEHAQFVTNVGEFDTLAAFAAFAFYRVKRISARC
jgi:hypothetical protein